MLKNKILILIFISLWLASNTFAMQQEYTILSLPEELNLEIFELKINKYVKKPANYDDYKRLIKKINILKNVSTTFNNVVDKVLGRIKFRLSKSLYNDLNTDYKLALLFVCIDNRDIALIKFYIEAQNNVNLLYGGDTALIFAASGCHKEILEILIKFGADVNCKCHNMTPLIAAIGPKKENKEIVEILIKSGADVNLGADIAPWEENYTALYYAFRYDFIEIAEILIKNGIDLNLGGNVAAFLYAAKHGFIEIVDIFIKSGVDVNLQILHGSTALILAVEYNHKEIVELLVKSGANVNLKSYGDTALEIAVKRGKKEIVEILKKNDAN